jgi:hypothetical protein
MARLPLLSTRNSRPPSANHPSAPGHSRSASSSSPQHAKNWPGFVGSTATRIVASGSLIAAPPAVPVALRPPARDNAGMTLLGHVRNGVVVPDPGTTFPEGTRVAVAPLSPPPAGLPTAPGGPPGSIPLTNERIAQILDDEEAEAAARWFRGPA